MCYSLLQLPVEVLEHIVVVASSAREGVQLRCTCRTFWKLLDDAFFKRRCYDTYGEIFWSRALARPPESSRPLPSWCAEWQRIERFQEASLLVDGYRMPNAFFYHIWDTF